MKHGAIFMTSGIIDTKEEEVVSKLKYYVENNFELEQKSKEKYNKFFYTKENIRRKLVEEIDRCCT